MVTGAFSDWFDMEERKLLFLVFRINRNIAMNRRSWGQQKQIYLLKKQNDLANMAKAIAHPAQDCDSSIPS